MKVSIIMSCTDRPRNLRNALESWSRITYPDYELILIDNATADPEIPKIIKEYSPKFKECKGWRNLPITAVNKLWNMAARLSEGEYVIFAMMDEILSDYDIVQKMVAFGEQRVTVTTMFLDEKMTDSLDKIEWKTNPKLIESLPGFGTYRYKGTSNMEHVNAAILSHIIGWTRERWEWFGWFRNDEKGHLWLDQDIVIRSGVLGIKSQTVDSCYHQWHSDKVNSSWLAPGYHPVNERQARLLEPSERDKS